MLREAEKKRRKEILKGGGGEPGSRGGVERQAQETATELEIRPAQAQEMGRYRICAFKRAL